MELNKRNALVVEHLPLVETLSNLKRKSTSPNITFGELFSAGCLALVESADSYLKNESNIASFKTFVSSSMLRAMDNYIHREVSAKLSPRGKNSPNMVYLDDQDENENSSLLYCGDESFEEIIDGIPEDGKQVLRWYYIDRLTYEEIGNKINGNNDKVKIKRLLATYINMLREVYLE